jgi:uncharacterized protein YgfB (UPF0149 family)
MTEQAQYDNWADFLLDLQAIVTPAELHGMLCGRLSGGQRLERGDWLDAAISFMDLIDTALDDDSRDRLVALYDEALAELSDMNQPLTLLLPPDELSLRQRIGALSGWCESFLHGLGASGLSGTSKLPPEVTEALRDFAHIAQAEMEEDEADENEQYYAELVEYVRVAVLTLFVELNPQSSAPPEQVH